MFKKIVVFTLAVAILGALFSALTKVILEFVPYFFCGMVAVSPFYGMYRKVSKKKTYAHGLKKLASYIPRLIKFTWSGKSVMFYMVLAIIVVLLRTEIVVVLLQTILGSIATMLVMFLLWEGARVVIRAVRRIDILSFKEAMKSAL